MYDKNPGVPVHRSLQNIKKIEQTHNYRLAARRNYLIPKKEQNMKKNFFVHWTSNLANNTN